MANIYGFKDLSPIDKFSITEDRSNFQSLLSMSSSVERCKICHTFIADIMNPLKINEGTKVHAQSKLCTVLSIFMKIFIHLTFRVWV